MRGACWRHPESEPNWNRSEPVQQNPERQNSESLIPRTSKFRSQNSKIKNDTATPRIHRGFLEAKRNFLYYQEIVLYIILRIISSIRPRILTIYSKHFDYSGF